MNRWCLAVLAVLIPLALTAQERRPVPGPHQEMKSQPVGKSIVPKEGLGVTQVAIPAAESHKVHFAIDARASQASWQISVTTTAGDQIAGVAIAPGAIVTSEWTPPFVTGEKAVRISVAGPANDTPPKVTVVDVAAQTTPADPQAICGPDDLEGITDATVAHFASLGRPVGRLSFERPGGWYTCTAFVVGKKYVLTNHHCIATAAASKGATVTFDKDSKNHVGTRMSIKAFVVADATLDYALLELESEPPQDTGSVAVVADARPAAKAALVIIGHPAGRPKEVSVKGCAAASAIAGGAALFDHYCDTEPGSSGSPVFDLASGRLVGLHHVGVENCGPATWGNEAIAIDVIAKHLKANVDATVYAAVTASLN